VLQKTKNKKRTRHRQGSNKRHPARQQGSLQLGCWSCLEKNEMGCTATSGGSGGGTGGNNAPMQKKNKTRKSGIEPATS
jgi:hypothetical protein